MSVAFAQNPACFIITKQIAYPTHRSRVVAWWCRMVSVGIGWYRSEVKLLVLWSSAEVVQKLDQVAEIECIKIFMHIFRHGAFTAVTIID